MKENISFHEFMAWQIDNCGITQKELADRLGYKNANNITIFKQGKARFPLDKVTKFAKEIGLDQSRVLRMAMTEYCPELLEIISETFNFPVTENEKDMVIKFRQFTSNSDPRINSKKTTDDFETFCKSLIM